MKSGGKGVSVLHVIWEFVETLFYLVGCSNLVKGFSLMFMLTAEAMVLSSSSEEESPDFGGNSPVTGVSSDVATEANAVPVGQVRDGVEKDKVKANTGPWVPERVSLALTASADFAEFEEDLHLCPFLFWQGGRVGSGHQQAGVNRGTDRQVLLPGLGKWSAHGLPAGAALLWHPRQLQEWRSGRWPCRAFLRLFLHGSSSSWRTTACEELGVDLRAPLQHAPTASWSRQGLPVVHSVDSDVGGDHPVAETTEGTWGGHIENPPGRESQTEGSMWALPEPPTSWRSPNASRRGSTLAPTSSRKGSGGWSRLSLGAGSMAWSPSNGSVPAPGTSSISSCWEREGPPMQRGIQMTWLWSMPGWSSRSSGPHSTWSGGGTWRRHAGWNSPPRRRAGSSPKRSTRALSWRTTAWGASGTTRGPLERRASWRTTSHSRTLRTRRPEKSFKTSTSSMAWGTRPSQSRGWESWGRQDKISCGCGTPSSETTLPPWKLRGTIWHRQVQTGWSGCKGLVFAAGQAPQGGSGRGYQRPRTSCWYLTACEDPLPCEKIRPRPFGVSSGR